MEGRLYMIKTRFLAGQQCSPQTFEAFALLVFPISKSLIIVFLWIVSLSLTIGSLHPFGK
jgi:hypothetical protein